MPFSPSKNFIFIHITKTAGSSINDSMKAALGAHDYLLTGHVNHELNYFTGLKRDMEHLDVPSLIRILGKKRFDTCFKFCFVRNPWDRAVSLYFWSKKNPWGNPKVKEYVQTHTFEDFILKGEVPIGLPQYAWVTDIHKNIAVDFVGRYENLNEDFKKICQRVQVDAPELPHTFKTDHKPFKEYHTQATIDKVAQVFKEDIELFKYDY